MNFDLNEEQEVIRDLAEQVFAGQSTVDRVKTTERGDGFDRETWTQLAASGVQALCVPEENGGSGFGAVELSLALMAQGRHVALVPLWTTGVASLTLADYGTAEQRALLNGVADGSTVVTVALAEFGANDISRPATTATVSGDRVKVKGTKPAVPFAQHADIALVSVTRDDGSPTLVVLPLDTPGVTAVPVSTTNREPHAHLDIDCTLPLSAILGCDATGHAEHDGREMLRSLFEHSVVALASIQVGVAEGSLALTASHLSSRKQFGKPLSAFQATTQRAADGYITTEAMRVTALNAAWRLAEGFDARRDVAVAAYWASEGAQQVVTAGQHLHGGIGSDVDYPVHRYFLWGIQLANQLGSASSHLARLGQLIART
jgi:alkylation response protein AidB-like acyl-CoA dehydrogenase